MSESAVVSTQRWQHRHAALASTWHAITADAHARSAAVVDEWEDGLARMRASQQELVQSGRWRGGPRTLLAALDLHYRELAMTAGLAWLLRPDGHHGLGTDLLSRLLRHLEFDHDAASDVRVVVEEQRDATRADLVVYGSTWTIVVEAKTFAIEQEPQLDRLYDHWRDEPSPCFVFLSRGQRDPMTAVTSRGQWRSLTWHEVAGLARAAATSTPGAAAGVHDYIATLEAYHNV